MKPRWEMGALLSVACFSSVQGYTTYTFPTSTSSSWGFTTTSPTSTSSGEYSTYSSYYSPPTSPDCIPSWISDGLCDSSNNNADCAYDGGDCCVCDCVDTEAYCCGANGFSCFDPASDCFYHHYDDDFEYEYGVDCSSIAPSTAEPTTPEPTTPGENPSDDVGVIVGGTVGGVAVVAAAALLVWLFATGRLKCSDCCCSSSKPPAPPAPAGHGSVQTATNTFSAPAGYAAGPPAARGVKPPPPAYGSSGQGMMSTTGCQYPQAA
ncbi:unnamed protein product [Ectocarpus sp. 13 AM-2016]